MEGIRFHSSLSTIPFVLRDAILLAVSDIPPARKLCSFKGHSAERACCKCIKSFPGCLKCGRDFSGFDTNQWPPRCHDLHQHHADIVRRAACNGFAFTFFSLYQCGGAFTSISSTALGIGLNSLLCLK